MFCDIHYWLCNLETMKFLLWILGMSLNYALGTRSIEVSPLFVFSNLLHFDRLEKEFFQLTYNRGNKFFY